MPDSEQAPLAGFRRVSIRAVMGFIVLAAIAAKALRLDSRSWPLEVALLLAAVIVWGIPRLGGLRPSWSIAVAVLTLSIGIPLLTAALISKQLWGYYLERPSVDRQILGVRQVKSVTLVVTKRLSNGTFQFVPNPKLSIVASIGFGRNDRYYDLGSRVLIGLWDRGHLRTPQKPMSATALAPLYSWLSQSRLLEIDEPGYQSAQRLNGALVEAVGSDGTPLLFFGVAGGEVSNDHYPYYEFLFRGSPATTKPILLSFQRFYFDIAGIEGMEWPAIFLPFSALGLVVSIPVTAAWTWIRKRRVARRARVDRADDAETRPTTTDLAGR